MVLFLYLLHSRSRSRSDKTEWISNERAKTWTTCHIISFQLLFSFVSIGNMIIVGLKFCFWLKTKASNADNDMYRKTLEPTINNIIWFKFSLWLFCFWKIHKWELSIWFGLAWLLCVSCAFNWKLLFWCECLCSEFGWMDSAHIGIETIGIFRNATFSSIHNSCTAINWFPIFHLSIAENHCDKLLYLFSVIERLLEFSWGAEWKSSFLFYVILFDKWQASTHAPTSLPCMYDEYTRTVNARFSFLF